MTKPPRSNPRYWRGRVFRDHYRDQHGNRRQARTFSVRLQFQGRRKLVSLKTTNQEEASNLARDLWECLQRDGWSIVEGEAAKQKETDTITVGDYIDRACGVADVSEASMRTYQTALRLITAGALDVPSDDRNSNPHGWRERVDVQPLAALAPPKIQAWKLTYVGQAKDPEAQKRKKTSCNAYLRNARSLFSKAILKNLDFEVQNPFANIDLFPRTSHRYQSTINAGAILRAAAALPRAQYQIVALALLLGLRKREIDRVTWDLVDWERARLNLRETKHMRLKSDCSAGSIPIDLGTLELFRTWQAETFGEFVVEAAPRDARGDYRCDHHFRAVYTWLRGEHGVTSQKPLHELRKEFGSLVCQRHGIYAASRLLRHADIGITSAHYLADPHGDGIGTGLSVMQPSDQAVRRDQSA